MGYRREQFVAEVNANLICAICHEVLNDPHVICKNGHSYCKDCITKWLRTHQTCPNDNNALPANYLVRNLIVNNMVQSLEVWCHPPVQNEGAVEVEQKCEWKGELQSLKKHRETCPFQVQCPNVDCNTTLHKRELKHHHLVCPYKRVKCYKCGKMLARHELYYHTTEEGQEILIPCPNKCTSKGKILQIKRVDLDNHIKSICPKTLVFCPFMDQGCSVPVERQHVDKHLQDNMAVHMMLMAKENKQLKEELTRVKEEFHNELSIIAYTWTLHDYPKLAENNPNGFFIKSPSFWLSGSKWQISLYPNGDSADATGFLSLGLGKVNDDSQTSLESNNESAITFRLTVISQEPCTTDISNHGEHVFSKNEKSWGWRNFMKATDALLPFYCENGSLIIQCTIDPD